MPQIQVVASIDPSSAISVSEIQEALASGESALAHGEQFTGRPGTRIYASDSIVVKLRSELSFNEKDRVRWIERTTAHERELGVYHPSKTWLLLTPPGADAVIANATRRLLPLHQFGADHDGLVRQVSSLLSMYVRIGHEKDERLDEGLSNFGVDQSGRLYYLDDETYRWDNFSSLSQFLGVLFRLLEWLDEGQAQQIGDHLGRIVWKHQGHPHFLRVIGEQVRGLFFSETIRARSVEPFIDALFKHYRNPPDWVPDTQYESEGARSVLPSPPSDASSLLSGGESVAILADVHANQPALEAVLDELKKRKINTALVLGDLVGYGPHCEAVIDLIAYAGFFVVMGNHDYGLVQPGTKRGLSANARWVLDWSRERVRPEQKDWLAQLPPYLAAEGWLAVHGAPRDPSFFYGYVYAMTYEDNLDNIAERGLQLCFHGHSHMQGAYVRTRQGDGFQNGATVGLDKVTQALICPGSIGQPRGGLPGAEFAIYDPVKSAITFERIPYDIDAVARDMSKEGFPPALVDRLFEGR